MNAFRTSYLHTRQGQSWLLVVVVCCYVVMTCTGIAISYFLNDAANDPSGLFTYAYAQVENKQDTNNNAKLNGSALGDIKNRYKSQLHTRLTVPPWREIGPWPKLKWLVSFAPQRGVLLTEDSIIELIDELVTVGTVYERRDFLRNELREQVALSFVVKNKDLRQRLAELYLVGALDAFEDRQYVLAESFARTSSVIFPNLEGQQSLQHSIDKVFWRPNSGSNWYRSSYFVVLLIATCGALCVFALPSSLFVPKQDNTNDVMIEIERKNEDNGNDNLQSNIDKVIHKKEPNLSSAKLNIEVERQIVTKSTEEEQERYIFNEGNNKLDDDFELDEHCEQDDNWMDDQKLSHFDKV